MRKALTFLVMLLLLIVVGNAAPTSNVNVKKIVAQVSPSIVKVISQNHKKYIATGIAIAPDYIVSSTMITKYPYDKIYISTVKGETYDAKLVGKDRQAAILLLKIDKKILTPIKEAKNYQVGDWTALVGVFYQQFPSIYQGIVSSKSDEQLILNAPVAPGSSGGAVVNQRGELMGVIRGRFGWTTNPDYTYRDQSFEFFIQSSRDRNKDLCYAVPISKVKIITEDLKHYGKVRRGWLGVSIISSMNQQEVVLVDRVTKNSPADKAGIRKNDKIVRIEGNPVRNATQASRIIKSFKPGQQATIELVRGTKISPVKVIIGEAKAPLRRWEFSSPPQTLTIPDLPSRLPSHYNIVIDSLNTKTLGIDAIELTPELASKFKIKEARGLIVSKVGKNTAADKAGLEAADVIVMAGDINITNNTDLREAIRALKEEEAISIKIYRQGKPKRIKVIPEKIDNPFQNIFQKVREKLSGMNLRQDDEKLLENKLRQQYTRDLQLLRDNEIKKYQEAMEKMKKEQQQLRNELNRLLKLYKELEKKKEKGTT